MASNDGRNALIVTTVASTIDQFCMNDVKTLSQKYHVFVCANFEKGNNTSFDRLAAFEENLRAMGVTVVKNVFDRNPLSLDNIRGFHRLRNLLSTTFFDIIHCHTPVAAALTRLAVDRRKRTKVIYTAHGFHFFKGAPLKNWLLFYPIEKLLASRTDLLITINEEDYTFAREKLHAQKNVKIPGVGVDLRKFEVSNDCVDKYYDEFGISRETKIIISVGELNENKNHRTVLEALAHLKNKDFVYLLCGIGSAELELKSLVSRLGLESQVRFLGYRDDIKYLLRLASVFCFPSFREGLSVALMEAMAIGLPVVCSKIRGNVDLIDEGYGGFLVDPSSPSEFTTALDKIFVNENQTMGQYNKNKIVEYGQDNVIDIMSKLYSNIGNS